MRYLQQFHSIVSSGTTETFAPIDKVGYGMLVEGVLAVFAIGCVVVLTTTEREIGGGRSTCSRKGRGLSAGENRVDKGIAMLAISTFLLTTLDTYHLADFSSRVKLARLRRYLGTLPCGPAFLVFQTFPFPKQDLPVEGHLPRLEPCLQPSPCSLCGLPQGIESVFGSPSARRGYDRDAYDALL